MVEEYAKRYKEINKQFLCVTDHGMMGAVPRQIRAAEKYKLSPVFGCELYVNPMQIENISATTSSEFHSSLDPDDKPKFRKTNHLLAIAHTLQGYSNLVKLTSWGWMKGFYRYPRLNHEQLLKYKEGILFTTGCYNSEIGWAFDQYGEEAAFQKLEQYITMFSPNLYLEFMLLDFGKQKPYNAFIMKAKKKYGLPIIVSSDCHYCTKEDSEMQRLMLMIQTKKTIEEIEKESDETADKFELQDQNLYPKSERELNEKYLACYKDIIDLDIFEEAKRTTVEICQKAKGIQLDRTIKFPKFDDADDRLMEAVIEGFKKRKLPQNKQYSSRIREEFELIKSKGFASYFIIQKMMTDEARRISPILLGWGDGSEALGPGRGSVVGSLLAYLLGITEVDPLKHDLLFSRFLSPARGGRSMKLRFTQDPLAEIRDLQKAKEVDEDFEIEIADD